MKHLILIILFLICFSPARASVVRNVPYLVKIVVIHDTVFVDNTPYCLLKKQDDAYIISTLNLDEVMYIAPYYRNGQPYYRVSVSPTQEVYFADISDHFIRDFLHDFIEHQPIEDGYFSTYGMHMLVEDELDARVFFTEKELPRALDTAEIIRQEISWVPTDNKDSTVIMSGGVPFAYYTLWNWRDYGAARYDVRRKTGATYHYYIYRVQDNKLLAEVQVADWWQTQVTIITPDGWWYRFGRIPKIEDLMRVACKLVILRETLHH